MSNFLNKTLFTVRSDLTSGFLVFLIALPLCLGIAMASGFPPIAGIITAVIGGLTSFIPGVARLTIKGPAAGLIVIVIGCVQELGQGDLLLGYKSALAVGVCAAVIQIIFALFKFARFGLAMCPFVIHGMLAAIGVIIISKQLHTVLGVVPQAKSPFGLLFEIPASLMKANPLIAAIGFFALAILVLMPLIKNKFIKKVPAPLVALAITVPLGMYFGLSESDTYSFAHSTYKVGPQYLVQLPGSILSSLAFPDFSLIASFAFIKYVIMFALVGSIESTLSVLAVDSMDPERKPSNLNRDLFAVGFGNLLSSLVGGLPMIAEIVRSRANVDAGAKSRGANLFHGFFLLAFVALVPGVLRQIPLAVLAAMLVFVGTRLASPTHFIHAKRVGGDQLAYFLATFFMTLLTDLLVGVGVGIFLHFVMYLRKGVPANTMVGSGVEVKREGTHITICMHGAATCGNILPVHEALSNLPSEIDHVELDVTDTIFVDHTFISRISELSEEWAHADLEFIGMEQLTPCSEHKHSSRWRN